MKTNPYPKVKIVWGRRTSSITQESPVEIEIYHLRKRKWISTGVKAVAENWNETKWIVGRADAFDANLTIENLHTKIQNYIRKLIIDGEQFNWNAFECFLHDSEKYKSFIDFVNDRINTRKDITESSIRNHRKFHKALIDFGKIVSFKDLTKANIQIYDQWLHDRRDYKQTTIASYHKYMKVYINDALRMEFISSNPYAGFKINQGKPAGRKFLTMEELAAIEGSVMPTESIERVRDMFVFQCYTGLAYTDMRKFDFNTVIRKDGRFVLHDVRQKTGEDYYIVLLPKAMEVLNKYHCQLPIITNEQYNLRLKLVASYAGIKKNLTSHMGRHTYATMCLNSGTPIEVLAQMLGHSDIKTTQIYAKMVNSTVEDAYIELERNAFAKELITRISIILDLLLMLLNRNTDKIIL